MNKQADIEFLKTYLEKLQKDYKVISELTPSDFAPSPDGTPNTPEDAERCARLADQFEFDGSLFRNLARSDCNDPLWFDLALRELNKKIETIPRIIAAMETDVIPPNKLSPHYTPKQLTDIYDRSWDTVKKNLDSGEIRNKKHSTKDYQIHIDDLPPEQA